ncbi:MAG: CDP-alcohol phosphatidyltransferase family protein [Candidatus Aenigmarchaeota archaeon]|nr:CDP-alcohol phosphatidyltransferase family protein [Candidatus Aenigmarchaeota archaeon]
MTFYASRKKFSGLSSGIGKAFSKLGLSPNQWTLLSILPALGAFWFLVQGEYIYAAGMFIVSGFLDMVDGAVARETGKVSKKGAYLDTIVDRYVEFIVVFGIFFAAMYQGLPHFLMAAENWIFLFYFGSIMTTYAKAAAKEKGLGEINGGIIERAERLGILFIGLVLASVEPLYLVYTIALLAVLTNLSALQRIMKARPI